MKNSKIRLSAAELFALIDREFRRRRPPGCEDCAPPLPYPVAARAHGAANWEVMPAPDCEPDCRRVISQVVDELAGRYELCAD